MRWSVAVVMLLAGCALEVESAGEPVIGGRVVSAGEFPHVVALIDDAGEPFCTGTLIRDDAVLTAAHCLDADTGDALPEITFANDARAIAGPPLEAVSATEAHPSFDIDRAVSPGVDEFFDVAVLILAEPVADVAPALLPTLQEAEANLIPGVQVDIVGYGLRVDDPSSPDRGEKAHGVATVTTVGDSEVQISMAGEQQSCSGDSGGPALLDVPSVGPRLVGVVSRSADNDAACDSGSVNTRADAYLDFIGAALGDGDGSDGGSGGGDGDGGGGGGGDGSGGLGDPRDGGCAVGGSGGAGAALVFLVLLSRIRARSRAG